MQIEVPNGLKWIRPVDKLNPLDPQEIIEAMAECSAFWSVLGKHLKELENAAFKIKKT